MKITIYVKRECMDKLKDILYYGDEIDIKWHHSRRTPKDVEVTLTYDNYILLNKLRDA